MDREAAAAGFRRLYALVQRCSAEDRAALLPTLGDVSQAVLGPSFRFEPDMQRVIDIAPRAHVCAAPDRAPRPERPALAVIPGGASSDERPSARYIDSADDAPKAG